MLASETDKHWRKGYVSGTFDMFHVGHLNLIRRAKERCDYLVVGVLANESIIKTKKKWPVIPLNERQQIVGAIKYVDEVDITTVYLLNKINAWEKYHFDAMFSGDDHNNKRWKREEADLKERGADLVFFPYTKEVSTTLLKEITLPPKAESIDIVNAVEPFRNIFPFDRVSKGERVVLYGAGRVGAQYAAQLSVLDYCEIAAFADTYAKKGDLFASKRCLTPEELKHSMDCFDRIVISTVTYRNEVLDILRSLGVRPERIV